MRILVDTNVIVSGLIAKGMCFEILQDLVYSHTPIYTPYILRESREVLLKKFHLTKPTVNALLAVIVRDFTKAKSSSLVKSVCRDPDDDQILADALFNGVDYILTGDRDLLSIKTYQKIKMISPKEYWHI